MKKISVKLKLSIWLMTLMMILSVVLVCFIVLISNKVAYEDAFEKIKHSVESNIHFVKIEDRKPVIDSSFSFYHHGVSLLVYSKHQALLAGQLPLTFTAEEPFQNGMIRTVEVEEGEYLVMDIWIPSDWDTGVWVRGLLEAPDSQEVTHSLLHIVGLALPLFMVLAALGSYRIAKRTFRPLDHINATTEAIKEAGDLKGRIGLSANNDEFFRLAANIDDMFERLDRSFEAERQFTSDASHELRTPVSIIKSACEFAEKFDETPEERQETIEMIHRQADRMSRLIQQLLNMTRMEQGTEKIHISTMNVYELIKELKREEAWDEERCCIEVPQELDIEADRELLKRLLRNLIENGFKYGIAGGTVSISAVREKEMILISVTDNGIGIAEEEQGKIWNRFYQSDSSRSDEHGAGLGLSMVQQIAKLHGGFMSLKSEVGKGSTFTFHLPEKSFNSSET